MQTTQALGQGKALVLQAGTPVQLMLDSVACVLINQMNPPSTEIHYGHRWAVARQTLRGPRTCWQDGSTFRWTGRLCLKVLRSPLEQVFVWSQNHCPCPSGRRVPSALCTPLVHCRVSSLCLHDILLIGSYYNGIADDVRISSTIVVGATRSGEEVQFGMLLAFNAAFR